jgi:hypothetical protein
LNRETTMANRFPLALSPPSTVLPWNLARERRAA